MQRTIIPYSALFFLLLTFMFSLPGEAQVSVPRFEGFTSDDGLSQNSANYILQDTKGFIWIGTQDGLNRYDGYEFVRFYHERNDPSTLSNDHITTIFEDTGEQLWVGTYQGGLNRYNPEKRSFHRFPIQDLLKDSTETSSSRDAVYTLLEIGTDSLLLGTETGLVFFNAQNNAAFHINYASDRDTTALHMLQQDRYNRIWVGDEAGRLYRSTPLSSGDINQLTFELNPHISSERIRDLKEDQQGNIWIATHGNGVFKYEADVVESLQKPPQNFTKQSGLVSDFISTILIEDDGHVWLGYFEKGLGLMSPGPEPTFSSFKADPTNLNSLTHDVVHSLLVDRTGMVWIGTWNGLNRLSPEFEAIQFINQLRDGDETISLSVVAIHEDHAGMIWLGTLNGQLIQYNPHLGELRRFSYLPDSLTASGPIFQIQEDASNRLWIATHGRGVRILDDDRTILPFYNIIPQSPQAIGEEEAINSILGIDSDVTWFGTRKNGLKAYRRSSSTWHHYPPGDSPTDISNEYVWPLLKTRSGDLWIGAYTGGLHRYNEALDSFELFDAGPTSLTSNELFDLFEDSRGNIWIATGDGLNRLDPNSMVFTSYHTSDGLPFDRVMSINEDDYGNLWIGTNQGLAQFEPETEQFTNYFTQNGLPANRFFARSTYRHSDGRLLMGNQGGLVLINTDKINADVASPTLAWRSIERNSSPLALKDETVDIYKALELQYNDRLNISFSVLDFINTKENKYRYMLKPQDKEWSEFSSRSFATFASFEYGKHTLVVQGQNSKGELTQPLNLPLIIQAPYWKKPWFRILIVVSIAVIITGIIFLRARYLLGIANVRLGIAKRLHDDLGGNLSTISIQTGILQNKTSIGDRERRQLARVSNLARETAHTVREAVWLIDAEYDTLDKLISKMKDMAVTMFEGNLSFTFNQNPLTMPAKTIRMKIRENIYFLIKEALNNANKYSEATAVNLDIAMEGNQLKITVQDNGKGFCLDLIKRGNGLKLMQNRADELNGNLDIQSSTGQGTKIMLNVHLP